VKYIKAQRESLRICNACVLEVKPRRECDIADGLVYVVFPKNQTPALKSVPLRDTNRTQYRIPGFVRVLTLHIILFS
jgi:hypothetical protein